MSAVERAGFRMRRVTGVVAAVVLSGLMLAACGSDDGGGGASGSSAAPVKLSGDVSDHGKDDIAGDGSTPKLSLEAGDTFFGPTYVKAAPNATVTVTVKNEGKLAHNFSVDGQSVDVDLAPGASKVVQVKLPADGGLRFYCSIHQGSGMQGAIYTKEGVTVSGGTGSSGGGGSTPGY